MKMVLSSVLRPPNVMSVNEEVSGVPSSRADLIIFAGMQKGTTHLNAHVAEGAPTDQFDLQS